MSGEAGKTVIRQAVQTDLPSLTEIYNYEIVNTTVTFDMNPKTVGQRQEWFDAHNKDNHPLLAAEADGQTVGYACLSPYRLLEAYRETVELSVYVDHRFRGRGIGRALMQAVLEEARRREDIHCVVSVITTTNETSIRLHEQFGFTRSGVIREVGEKFGQRLDIVNYQLLV